MSLLKPLSSGEPIYLSNNPLSSPGEVNRSNDEELPNGRFLVSGQGSIKLASFIPLAGPLLPGELAKTLYTRLGLLLDTIGFLTIRVQQGDETAYSPYIKALVELYTTLAKARNVSKQIDKGDPSSPLRGLLPSAQEVYRAGFEDIMDVINGPLREVYRAGFEGIMVVINRPLRDKVRAAQFCKALAEEVSINVEAPLLILQWFELLRGKYNSSSDSQEAIIVETRSLFIDVLAKAAEHNPFAITALEGLSGFNRIGYLEAYEALKQLATRGNKLARNALRRSDPAFDDNSLLESFLMGLNLHSGTTHLGRKIIATLKLQGKRNQHPLLLRELELYGELIKQNPEFFANPDAVLVSVVKARVLDDPEILRKEIRTQTSNTTFYEMGIRGKEGFTDVRLKKMMEGVERIEEAIQDKLRDFGEKKLK